MVTTCLRCAACVALLAVARTARANEEARPTESPRGPRLVCDEPTFHFGEVPNDRDVEHAFVLRNVGDEPVEIQSTRAGCGCTVVSLSSQKIPPGEQIELKARLRLRGYSGAQRKSITVQSNDPITPTLTLYLEGVAVATLSVEPAHLAFGSISPAEPATRTAELRSAKPFQITAVETDASFLTTRVEQVSASHYRLHVSSVPPLEPGPLRATVRVKTDLPDWAEVNLPVSAAAAGPLMWTPREIVLSASTEAAVKRYVVVRPGSVRVFEVEGVDVPDPAVQVAVRRVASSVAPEETIYQIELEGALGKPELNGKELRIRTNVEGAREIAIPFRVLGAP